jgi:hypothetical protein
MRNECQSDGLPSSTLLCLTYCFLCLSLITWCRWLNHFKIMPYYVAICCLLNACKVQFFQSLKICDSSWALVTHACNPSTQGAGAGGAWVQGPPEPHGSQIFLFLMCKLKISYGRIPLLIKTYFVAKAAAQTGSLGVTLVDRELWKFLWTTG